MSFKRYGNNGNKLYELAAEVIKKTKNRTIGFKYAFNNTSIDKRFMRPVYGIAAKAINQWQTCDEMFKETGILEENPDIDTNLIRVIVVDLLWGNKNIIGKGEAIDAVLKKSHQFRKLLKDVEHKDGELQSLKSKQSMRVFYARVNTIKDTLESCLIYLTELGYSKINTPASYEQYLRSIETLGENEFLIDYHFKDLIVFNSAQMSFLIAKSIVQDKLLVIQNKSSLIPVNLMNVKPGDTVLDMCAAPGMKTSLIASLLKGKGKVYAVDNHESRFDAMLKNLKELDVLKNVECVKTDAILFKPENINVILLDAPCSGSGISFRLGETDKNPQRLRKLQWIQIKLLTSALTAHPSVNRVVYSTCSIYPEENEEVIDEIMKRNDGKLDYELVNCHELISGFSQGSADYKCGSFCLKVSSERDYTNGFFVAVFDRISSKPKKKFKAKNKALKRKISETKQEGIKDEVVLVGDEDNGQTDDEIEEGEFSGATLLEKKSTVKSRKQKSKKRKGTDDVEEEEEMGEAALQDMKKSTVKSRKQKSKKKSD